MNAPQCDMSMDLLRILDDRMKDRVKSCVRNPYEEGMKRVAATEPPLAQKFPVGSRVRIASDLGPHMRHFTSGSSATVLHTYAHAYGGSDVKSYALDIDGQGFSAWYQEHQLTLEGQS